MIWHFLEVWALLLVAFALGGAVGTVLYMALAVSPLADAQIALADTIADRVDAIRDALGRRRDSDLYRAHRDAPPPAYVMPLPAPEPVPDFGAADVQPLPEAAEADWQEAEEEVAATPAFDEPAGGVAAEAAYWEDDEWAPDEDDARWGTDHEWPAEDETAPPPEAAMPVDEPVSTQAYPAPADLSGPDDAALEAVAEEGLPDLVAPEADEAEIAAEDFTALDAAVDRALLEPEPESGSETVADPPAVAEKADQVRASEASSPTLAPKASGEAIPAAALPESAAESAAAHGALADADAAAEAMADEEADVSEEPAPRDAVADAPVPVAAESEPCGAPEPAAAAPGEMDQRGNASPPQSGELEGEVGDPGSAPAASGASSIVPLPAAPSAEPARSTPSRRPPVAGRAPVEPGTRPLALPGPRNGVPDNLQRIRGIGQKNEELLHSLGIFHFGQIAAWTPAEARWVANQLAFPERLDRDDWIGQAIALATGDTDRATTPERRGKGSDESPVAA